MFSERSAIDEADAEEPPAGHVVATSGGVLASLLLFCDPGDEVLVPEPGHPRVMHAAQLAGVCLAPYPLRYEDGRWRLDAAALWDAVGERTRAIVASSPNDVTGARLSDEELELLDSVGLPLLLDQRLARHPLEAAALEAPARAQSLRLTLDALDGAEHIAVAGPDAQVHEALARLVAIARALGAPEVDFDAHRARASLAALREALEGSGLEVPAVDAGWHAAVRLPPGEADARWVERLRERGVSASAGSSLGFPDEESWLVLSLRAEPEQLRLAARALRELRER